MRTFGGEDVKIPTTIGAAVEIKPAIIDDFNRYKCRVDMLDQFHSYYSFSWTMQKWWRNIFLIFLILLF